MVHAKNHRRLAAAAFWLLGPFVAGRPKDLRVLRIDDNADQTHDATGHLGEIRCRTLVISGGRDGVYPHDLVREMVAGIPDARHVDYPDAGHGRGGPRFAEDVRIPGRTLSGARGRERSTPSLVDRDAWLASLAKRG